MGVSRGVAYWHPQSGGPGRVVYGTTDGRMFVLDGKTGQLIPGFGQQGVLNLRTGIDEQCQFVYALTSPPSIYGDLVIFSVATGEWSDERAAAPGDIRAFDLNTGKEV